MASELPRMRRAPCHEHSSSSIRFPHIVIDKLLPDSHFIRALPFFRSSKTEDMTVQELEVPFVLAPEYSLISSYCAGDGAGADGEVPLKRSHHFLFTHWPELGLIGGGWPPPARNATCACYFGVLAM